MNRIIDKLEAPFWLVDVKETWNCVKLLGQVTAKLRQGSWPGRWIPRLSDPDDVSFTFDQVFNLARGMKEWVIEYEERNA